MASSSTDTKYFGFLPQEAVPGALLVATAIAAMIVVNSPLADLYHGILNTKVTVGPTEGGIEMKFSYWIKNGLMAIFFFFVGLELKRELLEGQLSNPAAAILPIISAAGGMAVPALIFLFFAAPAGFGHGYPCCYRYRLCVGGIIAVGQSRPTSSKGLLAGCGCCR
jgi:Na+:H+ antiporter, NhaA family